MIKCKSLIYFLLVLCTASSCYMTTEVSIPADKPMLVVNSINFSPDSTWLIEVSESLPFQSDVDTRILSTAKVSIQNEDGSEETLVPTPSGHGKGLYRGSTKPMVGKRFQLRVDAERFDPATATAELPEPVRITNVRIDSTKVIEALALQKSGQDFARYMGEAVACQITFSDPVETNNYYQIAVYLNYEAAFTDQFGVVQRREITTQYSFVNPDDNSNSNALMDDQQFNGTQSRPVFYLPMAFFLSEIDKIYIEFRSLSPELYRYLATKDLQARRSNDPFAQPVIVYDNIQNGAGIFAGYSSDYWILEK